MNALFQQIENWYNKPLCSVLDLDEGTGEHPWQWLLLTQTQSITAITVDPYHTIGLEFFCKKKLRTEERIPYKKWKQDHLLKGEYFGILIKGHFPGFIDNFAPCFQMDFFKKLGRRIKEVYYLSGTLFRCSQIKETTIHSRMLLIEVSILLVHIVVLENIL